MLLTNPMNTSNGLELDRGIYQGLTEKDVSSVDQVQSRRLGLAVQQKALDLRSYKVISTRFSDVQGQVNIP